MTHHLIWSRDPGVAPPAGITVTMDDGLALVEGPDRQELADWQLALLKARKLTRDDLEGMGPGAAPRAEVVVAAADLDALLNAKTAAARTVAAAKLTATKRRL